MEYILDGLNEQQKCAVTSPSNVLQVLAPPGSGKTKTLTTRVAYHIQQEGIKPWNIIVCTFTIKAAREMKERIRSFVGEKLENKLVLGTFHSVARRYLSTYGHYIGIPKQFAIADSNDSLAIIKRIVKRHEYSLEPAKARSRISKRKSGVITARPIGAKIDVEQQEFEAIFEGYEQELAKSKLLDYDDLLLRCVELLRKFPECVSNVEAVLIDEFQDTNHVQYELMNLFAQHRRTDRNGRIPKITIVGDPDQSIYSFRSAEIENLTRMVNKYPDTQVVHLEENYRSSGSILQSAIEIIEQDTARPPKKLLATHTVGQCPVLRTLPTAASEAAWLVTELRRSHHLNGGLLDFSDYAILLRSASLSRHIETELGKAGIPYRMVGGHKFFERVEVRILLDYLRVVSQPDHNDALLRVINVPSRSIGDTAIKILLDESLAQKKSLWAVAVSVAQGSFRPTSKISNVALKGLEKFVNVILTARAKLDVGHTTIEDILAHITRKISFEDFLKSKYKEEYEDRASNVDELVQLARSGKIFAEEEEELTSVDGVEQRPSTKEGPAELLGRFLGNIALATDADKHDATGNNDKVVISTIHAAKGLEWPVVFIPGAFQGSIPHSRSEDTDEERRLLYVGMTRAKALLYLSWPKKSSMSEQIIVSSFLSTPTIARYFDSKGPPFGHTATAELARILGRECPGLSVVTERFDTIGQDEKSRLRVEDNYYPEDGEELENHNPNSYTGGFGTTYSTTDFDSLKRRKVSHESYPLTARAEVPVDAPGFISAKQQMKDVPATNYDEYRPQEKVAREAIGSSFAKSVKPLKKGEVGQGNLLSFFARKTGVVEMKEKEMATSREVTTTRTAYNYDLPTAQYHQPKSHMGMLSSMTVKEIKTAPLRRPQFGGVNEAELRPGHILLSSSPPRPDIVEIPNEPINVDNSVAEKENTSNASTSLLNQGGFQRASTLQETTWDKISRSGPSFGGVRSLGAKSSGLTKVNKPYVRPTMRKP